MQSSPTHNFCINIRNTQIYNEIYNNKNQESQRKSNSRYPINSCSHIQMPTIKGETGGKGIYGCLSVGKWFHGRCQRDVFIRGRMMQDGFVLLAADFGLGAGGVVVLEILYWLVFQLFGLRLFDKCQRIEISYWKNIKFRRFRDNFVEINVSVWTFFFREMRK